MYDWAAKFAGLVNGTYPNITAKNASGPTATDGFPYTADGINDLNLGWMQAILDACPDSIDRTPNGMAESASESQILTALRRGVALPPGLMIHAAMNAATAAKCRLLQLIGQRALISTYQALADAVWVGSSDNASAPAFYKCDSDGTRNESGLYLQLPDCRGLFLRAAGANGTYTAANNTPYDGNAAGSFQNQQIVNHAHVIQVYANVQNNSVASGVIPGYNVGDNESLTRYASLYGVTSHYGTSVSTGPENRPASISGLVYITY